jgi:hypothetical protein
MPHTQSSIVPYLMSTDKIENGNTILINNENLKLSDENDSEIIDHGSKIIDKIRTLSFDFILARLAHIFSDLSNTGFDKFSLENEFTTPKILMYPFFVSMSNGHSKSLFNILGPFETKFIGPTSMSLLNLLDENGDKLNYFDSSYQKLGRYNLDLKGQALSKKKLKSWDEIIKEIKGTPIIQGVSFENIIVPDNSDVNRPLCYALDRGIYVLVEQSSHGFIKLNSDRLLQFANSYPKLRTLFDDNKVEQINYEDVKKGSPFYEY